MFGESHCRIEGTYQAVFHDTGHCQGTFKMPSKVSFDG